MMPGILAAVMLLFCTLPLTAEEIRSLDANAFFEALEAAREDGNAVLLDVRTPREAAGGMAPGALNIDYYSPNFRDSLDALDRNVIYFVYCRSGNRSGRALRVMEDLGFSTVYDLIGGWSRNADRLTSLPRP